MRRQIVMSVAILTAELFVAGKAMSGSLEPTSAPGPTMHTLEEIYQKVNAFGQFQTLSATTTVVNAGYYAATNLAAVDPDLATGNIRGGTTIFGVAGKTEVVDTTSGEAMASDLLLGKKAWVDGVEITGNMATRTLSAANDAVWAGYYEATNLAAVDPDLATGNIRGGTTIFGVAGRTEVVDTTSGDATASDLFLGKKAWVDGVEVMGNIATRTLSAASDTVWAGYYEATNLAAVDPDLATGNIRGGTTIFGVAGKTEVVDTTSGDATASDLFLGKKAWVDGIEVMGNIATRTLSAANDAVWAGYYEATNLAAVDPDLATGNIRGGTTIFGVAGRTEVVDTTSGDATASDLFLGKKAWVDGVEVMGNIATRTLSAASDTVWAGYYAATTLSTVDSDLATGNIRGGTTIFGVAGRTEVVDTTSGDAATSDLLLGKKAWVDGVEIMGNVATRTLSAANDAVSAGYYAATTLSAVDSDLVTGNIRGGTTIFGVAGKTEVVDTSSGDAAASDLLLGKKTWVDGVEITGNMVTRTLSAANDTVLAGYYAATTLTQVDTNLTAKNIATNVTMFGIVGTLSTNIYPSAVPKTGQTTSYLTGDDGDYEKGVSWPNPRFTEGTGTSSNCVMDNLTGLTWLKNPDALTRTWSNAAMYCEGLDGSNGRGGYADWRLPNWNELRSLIDASRLLPALPTGHPFINVPLDYLWSSTTYAGNMTLAWSVNPASGYVHTDAKTVKWYVWPVRGGQ